METALNEIQSKGLKRDIIDKFYTKIEIVNLCINLIKTHLSISYEDDLCIEPSAGNGSFIEGIKTLSKNFIFYDIKPNHIEVKLQDYLGLNCKEVKNSLDNNNKTNANVFLVDNKIHIIGNPPFGRQSSLAIKFIKKSCEFGDSVSFILPKSFKKDSLRKSIPSKFHLKYEADLPEKSFLVNGVEYDVPCIFQIWEKKDYDRDIVKKLNPINFIFVSKEEIPDLSIRRVGVNAGKIDTDIESKSIQSHYFIKIINNKSIVENIEKLNLIEYEFNNTVGPKSISKQEIIEKYNPLL